MSGSHRYTSEAGRVENSIPALVATAHPMTALAPGSGRLGREVIRAAGRVRDWLRDADRDPLVGPLADLVNAVDALLGDRPELGREVEGG